MLLSLCSLESARENSLLNNVHTLITALSLQSIQRHLLIVPVAATFKEKEIKEQFGLGRKTVIKAQKNFSYLSQGKCLKQDVKFCANYDCVAVSSAVHFILNDSNVQRLSWGTNTVLLDGREVDFPRLIR